LTEIRNILTFDNLSRDGLAYLPGTKQEVDNIHDILSEAEIEAEVYTGADATEESVKALSNTTSSILHFATHGFYVPQSARSKLDKAYSYISQRSTIEEQSLSRSGLLFAGASNSIANNFNIPKGCDDGILTSKEISRLDLTQVRLVVLSACNTGLGDIKREGVYGLQRGLKKAGVSTILMSLWKVDDTATKLLMSNFYLNLAKGDNANQALVKAQQYLRSTQNGKFNDPQYWAAFILLDGL